jgi:PAT family beta-lactamase induction signal transducer AmpG
MTGWLAAARVYLEPRVLLVMALGFASGLPLLLTLSTLSIWLAEEGVSKTTIGLFALVGTPYTFKFLWAPLIDRVRLPGLTALLGRRRGWGVLIQFLLAGAIVALGATDPSADPWATAFCAVLVAFLSASQDIVLDALRIELLEERQQGAGAAIYVMGYRLGMLAAGAGALFLAEALPWFWVHVAMAALLAVGVVAVLCSPEPADVAAPKGRGFAAWLYEAVVAPFADFMRRRGWLAILAFVALYKFGDSLAGVMANPFYLEMGFSKAEIAGVSKIFGLWATLIGGALGGLIVARLGVLPSLFICGLLQMFSNLLFAAQALVGHDLAMLTLVIAVENVAGGMGTAAFVAYLSGLCNVAYTATQYALFSAFMSFARTVLSSPGGALAEQLGWVWFFGLTTLAAIPGLLLLAWLGARGFRPREARA